MNTRSRTAIQWPIPFFTVWMGQSFSLVTSELIQFALVWWLTITTGSASVVATATALALLPKAILGPFIGALVDRWNRRVVLIASDVAVALALLWLASLFWNDEVKVTDVYIVAFVRAVGQSFKMSAMLASTSLMVPEKYLPRVSGLNQMVRGMVLIAAPLLGTLLMGLLPFYAIVSIDVVGAVIAITPLLVFAIPEPERGHLGGLEPGEETLSVWVDVDNGLRYIRNWSGAVGMLLLSTSINFIARPAFTPGLVAILVTRHFGGSTTQFGIMAGSMGVGMVIGGLVLSVWSGFRRPMQTSLTGVISMGLAILVIGVSPPSAFPLVIITIFLAGAMMSMCMAPIQALIQSAVEPSMQGRVFTLLESTSIAVSPISVWVAGHLFDALGPQAWYFAGGAAALLIGLAGFATPAILNMGAPQTSVRGDNQAKTLIPSR